MLNVSISFANLVMWILVGGLAGWLASLVVRGGGLGLVGDGRLSDSAGSARLFGGQ